MEKFNNKTKSFEYYIVSASSDFFVKIWIISSGHLIRNIQINSLSFVYSPDSKFLFVGTKTSKLIILEKNELTIIK